MWRKLSLMGALAVYLYDKHWFYFLKNIFLLSKKVLLEKNNTINRT